MAFYTQQKKIDVKEGNILRRANNSNPQWATNKESKW